MRRNIMIVLSTLAVAGPVAAQDPIGDMLRQIETNNLQLRAQEHLREALVLEARAGNSLENPTVGYDRLWEEGAGRGVESEINLSQSFDFPTAYVRRGERARSEARAYGYEYAAFRQELLLQAEELCINLIALRKQEALLGRRLENAERLAAVYAERLEMGDATVFEKNKIDFELVSARNALRMNRIELDAALASLTALNGGVEAVFEAADFVPRPEPEPFETMIVRYENEAPALLALYARREAADDDVRVNRAQALPKFEVGYRREMSPGEKFNGITVGMSIPMFGNRHQVKRAKAQALYAERQAESSRVESRTALARLYAQAEVLRGSIDGYGAMLSPERNIELLNRSLEAGQITVIEYFAELGVAYDVYDELIVLERDLRLVYARIGAIDL